MSSIPSAGGSGSSLMAQIMQRRFQQADIDNSGTVSKDEFSQSMGGESGGDIFSKLDGNGDGQLTQEEAVSGIEKMMAMMRSQSGYWQSNQPDLLKALDKDA